MMTRKMEIINSNNPHWCVSYLKDRRNDEDVDGLVKVIMGGRSALALFELSKLRSIDIRFKGLARDDLLGKLKGIGVKSVALEYL